MYNNFLESNFSIEIFDFCMKRKTDFGVNIKFSTFKNLKLLTDSYAFVMLMVFCAKVLCSFSFQH
jgi:hypothetical protein